MQYRHRRLWRLSVWWQPTILPVKIRLSVWQTCHFIIHHSLRTILGKLFQTQTRAAVSWCPLGVTVQEVYIVRMVGNDRLHYCRQGDLFFVGHRACVVITWQLYHMECYRRENSCVARVGVTRALCINYRVKDNFETAVRCYICQVSPQLSCVDTCQIWTWYSISR